MASRQKQESERYLENWQDEINSAYLYRASADVESQPTLAEVYRRLAATEESHAEFWQEKLLTTNYPITRRKVKGITHWSDALFSPFVQKRIGQLPAG